MVLPAGALVLVGIWNLTGIRSVSRMEKRVEEMRRRVSDGKNSRADALTETGAAPTKNSLASNSKNLAAQILLLDEGSLKNQIRARLKLEERFAAMSREELIEALDGLQSEGLTDAEIETLEGLILEPLILLDREYALARFIGRIEDDSSRLRWQLAGAFSDWAKQNLPAATAWYDRQIGEGVFESRSLDGKSEMRVKFESALLETLISTDLQTARQRIEAMPEDQRREMLENLTFTELSIEERKAYAELVRQCVPADERGGSFAHIATQLVDGQGFDGLSSFLDAVQASPAERFAAAKQGADAQLESLAREGDLDRQALEELRDWLVVQAPDKVDEITGKALAEAAQEDGEFDFSAAAKMISDLQSSAPNDELIAAFLSGYAAHSNLEQARLLANTISDPSRRALILNQLK